jgi:hypothetical protein
LAGTRSKCAGVGDLGRRKKSGIQARRRKQPTLSPAPGRSTRVEHEYFREGAWTYLAAWDVHRAKVFGRCEKKTGIAPVDRLIGEVMSREPYQSARRVFSGSWTTVPPIAAKRRSTACARNGLTWSSCTPPSTLAGSIRLRFTSLLSRGRYLTPNDFKSLNELEQRLLAFQQRCEETASPFQWTFTRKDLTTLLAKIENKRLASAA